MNLLLAIEITYDFRLWRFSLSGFSFWPTKLGTIKSMQSIWISYQYAPPDWFIIFLWIFTCIIQKKMFMNIQMSKYKRDYFGVYTQDFNDTKENETLTFNIQLPAKKEYQGVLICIFPRCPPYSLTMFLIALRSVSGVPFDRVGTLHFSSAKCSTCRALYP